MKKKVWIKTMFLVCSFYATDGLPGQITSSTLDGGIPGMQQGDGRLQLNNEPPPIFYSITAIILIVEGDPFFSPNEKNETEYVVNANRDLSFDKWADSDQECYASFSGRLFRAGELIGPWSFVGPDLPVDFAKIII